MPTRDQEDDARLGTAILAEVPPDGPAAAAWRRAEFFNALNQTNFAQGFPASGMSTNPTSSLFGRILNARDPKNIQLAQHRGSSTADSQCQVSLTFFVIHAIMQWKVSLTWRNMSETK
jgi:hypothetical protein